MKFIIIIILIFSIMKLYPIREIKKYDIIF